MVDIAALWLLLRALAGRWNDQHQETLAYLIEENRIFRAQLRGRRLRLTDEDRRRLARRGHRLGRRLLSSVPVTHAALDGPVLHIIASAQ